MKKGEKVRGSLSSFSNGLRVGNEEERAGARESALLNREQNMFLRREILQVPPSSVAVKGRGSRGRTHDKVMEKAPPPPPLAQVWLLPLSMMNGFERWSEKEEGRGAAPQRRRLRASPGIGVTRPVGRRCK